MHQATTDARAGQMIATTVQQHLAMMAAPLPEMPTVAAAPTIRTDHPRRPSAPTIRADPRAPAQATIAPARTT